MKNGLTIREFGTINPAQNKESATPNNRYDRLESGSKNSRRRIQIP